MVTPTSQQTTSINLSSTRLLKVWLLTSLIGISPQVIYSQAIPVKPRDAIRDLKTGIKDITSKTIANRKAKVQPTPKTKIKIQGLTGLSERDALLLLGNIIDELTAHQPSPSRADDTAFLLEQTLRKNGYPEADVEWSIPKGKSVILLTVNQGPTRNMGTIHVAGVNEELQKTIETYFKSEPGALKILANNTLPYIPDHVEEAVENATSYLHSEGYWLATIHLVQTKNHPETGLVDLYLKVHPGPLYLLAPTKISGVSPLDLTPLRKQLAKFTGKTANTSNILSAQSEAVQFFTKEGYTFATTELTRTLIGNKVHLTIILNVGNKYRIGNVNILGLERTDPAVMKRRFDRIKGRYYDPAKMTLNRRKLISTGAFESVLLGTHPNTDGTIDLTLRTKEGRARSIGTHIGAGSYEGGIFGLSYSDRNFRGKLQSLSISAEISGLGLFGQASITDPMFLGSDRSVTLKTFLISHEFDGYSKYEAGLGAELVWTITDHYSIRFYADGLIASTSSAGLPDSELGYQDYTVARIGAAQKLDFRNSPITPNRGFHGELLTETGVANGDSAIPYSRVVLKTSYRQPINKKQYILVTGQAGTLFNDDPDNLPIDLRFFMGGTDSVRSFPKREMGPEVSGNYTGGEAFWATSFEYNRQVVGPVWTNLFVDAGALARYASDLGSTDAKYAAGLGFWLDLPIGPIRAEYGYNLNREKGEPAGTFHFTIGVTF